MKHVGEQGMRPTETGPRRTRVPLAIPLIVAGMLGAASTAFAVGDSDLYWHLATARETVAHGLVRSDLFSWTARGAPVSTDQWAGQLLLYAGYVAGGWTGVLAVRTLAVAALVGLIVAAALARSSRSPLVAVLIALPAVLLSRFIWTERPELFGAVCFAALVLLLQLGGDRPLVGLAPLLVVWAQLHGSFAVGVVLVALVGVHGIASDAAHRRAYAIALAGAVLSLVLTPAGLTTIASPRLHLLEPPREIQEWSLPDLATLPGAIWAIVLGLVVATAALAPPARARDVLVLVPVALLSLVAIRHTPLFAIAATPYLAERLPLAVDALARRAGASLALPPLRDRALPRRWVDLAAAVLAAVAIAAGIGAAPREPAEDPGLVAALADLPAGPGLFHQYDWGGWLIWRAPATPVFIDGRLIPYRGAVLEDYRTILDARPGWRDVIARRGIRSILVRPADPVAVRALDLGWRALSRSGSHVLIEVPHRSP